jgi:glutathione-regulated potassium-efflux system ancillary protein KefG
MQIDEFKAKSLRILILFAHPNFHKSVVNRELIKPLQNVENITFHDLYEAYPDFFIDVKTEQDLIRRHDVIAFMHPFFWYSSPALLKEWQDLVLENGFAYGEKGVALQGKKLLSIITTDGSQAFYESGEGDQPTIQQLLKPIEQMARLCGMQYLSPLVFYDVHHIHFETLLQYAQGLKNKLLEIQKGIKRDKPSQPKEPKEVVTILRGRTDLLSAKIGEDLRTRVFEPERDFGL